MTAGPLVPLSDGVAFTPDGEHFLSMASSGRLRVHDLADGESDEEGIKVSTLGLARQPDTARCST